MKLSSDSDQPAKPVGSLIEQADARTVQANTRTDEANTRTAEANIRTDEANVRTVNAEALSFALRNSELSYRRLFETAQDGILILDAETGRVNDVNPFLIKLLGFSHGEMVGKTVGELSPFKDIVSNQAMLALLQKDRHVRYHDLPLETKDGRKVDVEFVSNVYSVGDAQVIQCNIREITDRKRVEAAFQPAQLFLEDIINSLSVRVFWKDKNLVYLGCNTVFARDAGFAGQKDIIGKDDNQMIWREQAEAYRSDDCQVIGSGQPKLLIEESQTTPAGKTITLLSNKLPLRDAKGEIIGVLGTYMDITERKLADEKMRQLVQAVEQSPVSIVFTDAKGAIEYVNRKFTEVTGYSSEEAIGQNPRILKSGEFPPAAYKEMWETITSGKTWSGEFHNIKKNGEPYWEQASISPVFDMSGKLTHFLAVKEDITARKRSDILLHQSEERYRSLVNNASSAIFTIAPDGTFTSLNPAVEVMSGVSRSDWLGKSFSPMVHPDDLPLALKMFSLALKGENPPVHELRGNPSLKIPATMEMVLSAQKDEHEKIIGVLGIGRDVSARKQLEEEMPWKNALLQAQLESALDGILVVDSQGKKILQNERMSQLWKIPPQIADDKDDAAQVQFVASQSKNPKEFAKKVAHLYSHHEEASRDEIELIDGTILDRYSSPVRGRDGKYFGRIWTFRDITERLKLESQFRQSQKMEAIGKLAGGVAHDFNNILAVIQMQADLLKTEAGNTPAHLETAMEIGRAVQRASALTRQLLLFSRKQMMQLRDLDLNESINEMTKMLRRTLGENIQLQFKFAMQNTFVHADAGMMDQVLLNLALNARDAMPKGGRLLIETSTVDLDKAAAAKIPRARPGSFVCLSVEDTGCGIPSEVFHRIFEPFYTTKEVGKGTGLGLATVFGIVQLHHGWIEFQSQVGYGTTFRIYLPRVNKMSGQETVESVQAAIMRGGNETILLVEDDVALCASVRKILSQLGYCVLEAVNGIEALKVWEQNRDKIHLLLTDVVMPGNMSGLDLGQRLLKENPKLKVIYNSGYSAEVAGKDFPLKEGVNFLIKPFDKQKLTQTIRNSLDSGLPQLA